MARISSLQSGTKERSRPHMRACCFLLAGTGQQPRVTRRWAAAIGRQQTASVQQQQTTEMCWKRTTRATTPAGSREACNPAQFSLYDTLLHLICCYADDGDAHGQGLSGGCRQQGQLDGAAQGCTDRARACMPLAAAARGRPQQHHQGRPHSTAPGSTAGVACTGNSKSQATQRPFVCTQLSSKPPWCHANSVQCQHCACPLCVGRQTLHCRACMFLQNQLGVMELLLDLGAGAHFR
jgi:hypothetical protein